MDIQIEASADVSNEASIGAGTSIWHLAQVREKACLGKNCTIGRGVYIGPEVVIGDNVKVQNYALIYDPAVIADGVFIGPGVVLTNDMYPRAITPNGDLKNNGAWEAKGVSIGEGASIGARTVVLAGVEIGQWSLIGSGSVVIRDVPDFALIVGNPGKQIGWVGRSGMKLTEVGAEWHCGQTGDVYGYVHGTFSFVRGKSPDR